MDENTRRAEYAARALDYRLHNLQHKQHKRAKLAGMVKQLMDDMIEITEFIY